MTDLKMPKLLELASELQRKRPTLPENAKRHASNLIEQIDALKEGRGNPKTLPALMRRSMKRLVAANAEDRG